MLLVCTSHNRQACRVLIPKHLMLVDTIIATHLADVVNNLPATF